MLDIAVTQEVLIAAAQEELPTGVSEEQANDFFARFELLDEFRTDGSYSYIVRDNQENKSYELLFAYSSWDGVEWDCCEGHWQVEQREVVVTKWVAI